MKHRAARGVLLDDAAIAEARDPPSASRWRDRCNASGAMPSSWLFALAGGAMIGAAAALLLLTHGRIAGISGVVGSLLTRVDDRGWRLAFVAGLLAAGAIGAAITPAAIGASVRTLPAIVAAGLLVGFGTRLGNGCTSGHGVCGLSRRSGRALVAVLTFMSTGAITAAIAGSVS